MNVDCSDKTGIVNVLSGTVWESFGQSKEAGENGDRGREGIRDVQKPELPWWKELPFYHADSAGWPGGVNGDGSKEVRFIF